MNEVTKLYENAGVIKNWNPTPYGGIEEFYPTFTAEKQIKIIEWLGNSKAFFDANETITSLITKHKDKNGVVKGYEGKGNSVDSCLASLINDLWQDLTDTDKVQIKEILE
jgi:hypothetical protein